MLADFGCIFLTLAFLGPFLGLTSSSILSCDKPLGFESGNITNEQFEFPDSSYYTNYEPWRGRLNGPEAYCTRTWRASERWYPDVYFTINLRAKYVITGLAFQKGKRIFNAGSYMRLYTLKDGKELLYNGSHAIKLPELDGEMDRIYRISLEPTVAEKIRVQFQGSENHHCVRMEIYGCELSAADLNVDVKNDVDTGAATDVNAEGADAHSSGGKKMIVIVIVAGVVLLYVCVALCWRYRQIIFTPCFHREYKAARDAGHNNECSSVDPRTSVHI